MKTKLWFQTFACGAAVSLGCLLCLESSMALDDPTNTTGKTPSAESKKDESSNNEDSKPSPMARRKGNLKKSKAKSSVESSEVIKPDAQTVPPKTETQPSEYALATALLANLSSEHMKSLGEMLDQDWKDRPEWGEMAVAILKNDFMRPGAGWWKPSSKRYDWSWLSERLDANKDGKIERDEFPNELAKADQLFERLDRDGDGKLMPTDFDYSESSVPAFMNIAAMKNMMSNQLFSRLDKDSNGRVTMDELAEFFRYGDKEALDFLTPEDLRFAIDEPPRKKSDAPPEDNPAAAGPNTPSAALKMFLRGDMGWLTAGPQLGDPAPDFTLPIHDGSTNVKLSDAFGKRPVVLVFGSFT